MLFGTITSILASNTFQAIAIPVLGVGLAATVKLARRRNGDEWTLADWDYGIDLAVAAMMSIASIVCVRTTLWNTAVTDSNRAEVMYDRLTSAAPMDGKQVATARLAARTYQAAERVATNHLIDSSLSLLVSFIVVVAVVTLARLVDSSHEDGAAKTRVLLSTVFGAAMLFFVAPLV